MRTGNCPHLPTAIRAFPLTEKQRRSTTSHGFPPAARSLRRFIADRTAGEFKKGAAFYPLRQMRLGFYRARLVNGLGQVVHERQSHDAPRPRELSLLVTASAHDALPPVVQLPEATA